MLKDVGSYALHATAKFFDRTVEETFLRRGAPLVFGGRGPLAVPVSEERPVLATARWLTADAVRIEFANGEVHQLVPEEVARVAEGPVELEFRLVKQGILPRMAWPSLQMSLGWFVVVVATTVAASSASTAAEVVEPYACTILERAAPWHPRFAEWFQGACVPQASNDGSGGVFTAEYLQRLLRQDYAGADEGHLEPHKGEASKQQNSYYLPAGAPGPATQMGGAADTAPTPVRTQGLEEPTPAAAKQGQRIEVTALETAEPLAQAADRGDDAAREGFGAEGSDEKASDKLESPPAEEKMGWGVRDWYDVADERLDHQEIRTMLNVARQRLRIDPTDPDALGVLSYYQYLAQDYEGAAKTYDTFIQLYPDASAGYNNKALIYKRKGEYAKEEELYRIALLLSPDEETALNNLAVCYAHQGRFDEALAVMKRLETIDPDDAYADLHRAKILAAMQNDETAYFYLEKSLEGMKALDTLHHIEFRQDIRLDPAFDRIRSTERFRALLVRYYGKDTPLQE
jgi:tetratricopeptide (TPR) repeat protein